MDEHSFSTDGVCCGLARLHVTFGGSGGMMATARTELPYPCVSQANTRGSGGMMATARTELPYPCVSQAKTRGESSRSGK